jgi:hypothetical protein
MILGIEKQKTNGRDNARPLITVTPIIINFVLKFLANIFYQIISLINIPYIIMS